MKLGLLLFLILSFNVIGNVILMLAADFMLGYNLFSFNFKSERYIITSLLIYFSSIHIQLNMKIESVAKTFVHILVFDVSFFTNLIFGNIKHNYKSICFTNYYNSIHKY